MSTWHPPSQTHKHTHQFFPFFSFPFVLSCAPLKWKWINFAFFCCCYYYSWHIKPRNFHFIFPFLPACHHTPLMTVLLLFPFDSRRNETKIKMKWNEIVCAIAKSSNYFHSHSLIKMKSHPFAPARSKQNKTAEEKQTKTFLSWTNKW